MHGLPKEINLAPMEGCSITQVCISQLQCILQFGDEVKIAVENEFDVTLNDVTIHVDSYAENASALCTLLDARVSEATRDDQGGLIVRFSNGALIHLFNDGPEYECFQLHLQGRVFVG